MLTFKANFIIPPTCSLDHQFIWNQQMFQRKKPQIVKKTEKFPFRKIKVES